MQLRSDQCMFKSHDGELYLAIHVDDGIIIGKDITGQQRNFDMSGV